MVLPKSSVIYCGKVIEAALAQDVDFLLSLVTAIPPAFPRGNVVLAAAVGAILTGSLIGDWNNSSSFTAISPH